MDLLKNIIYFRVFSMWKIFSDHLKFSSAFSLVDSSQPKTFLVKLPIFQSSNYKMIPFSFPCHDDNFHEPENPVQPKSCPNCEQSQGF